MEAGSPPPPGSTPPQGPGPSGTTPTPHGGYETYPPAGGRPSRGWWAGAVAVAVVALAGGYLLGYDRGQSNERDNYAAGEPAYDAIYEQGVEAGAAKGAAAGETAGKQQGEAEGEKAGFEKGKQQGESEGTAAGASAALGGLTNWDASLHYIIKMAEGPSKDIPFVISARTQMQAGNVYSLCQSDPTVVCVRPVSEPADSGG